MTPTPRSSNGALSRIFPLVAALGLGACSVEVEPVAAPPGAPWFKDITDSSGLGAFHHDSGANGRFLMPEIMTTGAALVDVDGDGDLDAYLAQATGVDVEPSERRGNQLFLNDGFGHFEDATEGSGADDRGYAMGVATGDFDGDGDMDLYVSNLERNTLLRNDGGGKFTDVTDLAGVGGSSWSASAAFVDPDLDGDLDLFVANYVYWSVEAEIICNSPQGVRTYCSPISYGAPAPDSYYENQGDGTFVDASDRAGLRAAFGNGLGVVCADFDLDGAPEIFVANDGTPNQLWDPQPDGTFKEKALIAGCAVDTQGAPKAGMGVSVADIDSDGDEDLLVVNLTGEADSFYRNDGGQFVDRTPAHGLAVVSRRRTRFGVSLRDFNLDGELDLYQANGRVTAPEAPVGPDPFAEENVLLRGVEGGRFEEIQPRGGTSIPLVATSRAAAFGDVDKDGDVDILVHNRDGRPHLLENVSGQDQGWMVLDVRLANGAPAIGAAVYVNEGGKEKRYEIRTADSYGAASSHLLHLATGELTAGDLERVPSVRVVWPGGKEEVTANLPTGMFVQIDPAAR